MYVIGEQELDFMWRVRGRLRLPSACREQDKMRQRLRRMGLVEFLKTPRRWVLTEAGCKYLNERKSA